MLVIFPRKMAAAFRRKARKLNPREHGVLLYGQITADAVSICELLQPRPCLSSPDHFWHDPARTEPQRPSGIFLGTLHSHCGEDAMELPSDTDWISAMMNGEYIHGIYAQGRGVAFYLGVPAALRISYED